MLPLLGANEFKQGTHQISFVVMKIAEYYQHFRSELDMIWMFMLKFENNELHIRKNFCSQRGTETLPSVVMIMVIGALQHNLESVS